MESAPYVDKNIELKFVERGCPLGFACRASGIGAFEVRVFADAKEKKQEIARFTGGDERVPMPTVISNAADFPTDVIADLYHMARCRREMKRVGPEGAFFDGYANGYKYHRDRFLKNWKRLGKAEEAMMNAH